MKSSVVCRTVLIALVLLGATRDLRAQDGLNRHEVHGGRIWVESEGAGHGSTFRFTLSKDGD